MVIFHSYVSHYQRVNVIVTHFSETVPRYLGLEPVISWGALPGTQGAQLGAQLGTQGAQGEAKGDKGDGQEPEPEPRDSVADGSKRLWYVMTYIGVYGGS